MPIYYGTDSTRYKLYTNSGAVKPHLFEGTYIIEDGKLLWANTNLKLKLNESDTSSGSDQYINTGYIPKNNTIVECKFTFDVFPHYIEGSETQSVQLFTNNGGYNVPEIYEFMCINGMISNHTSAGFWGYGKVGGYEQWNSVVPTTLINKRPYIVYQNPVTAHEQVYDTVAKEIIAYRDGTRTFDVSTIDNPFHTLWNKYGSASSYSGTSVYYLKIWEDDTLVRYYVPVPAGLHIGDYTVSSNGLWDIVTQQFFGNAGRGEYIFESDDTSGD